MNQLFIVLRFLFWDSPRSANHPAVVARERSVAIAELERARSLRSAQWVQAVRFHGRAVLDRRIQRARFWRRNGNAVMAFAIFILFQLARFVFGIAP